MTDTKEEVRDYSRPNDLQEHLVNSVLNSDLFKQQVQLYTQKALKDNRLHNQLDFVLDGYKITTKIGGVTVLIKDLKPKWWQVWK